MIIRNALKCLECGDIIESKSSHDYVECSCGLAMVDGGRDYARQRFYPEKVIDLTEFGEDEDNN